MTPGRHEKALTPLLTQVLPMATVAAMAVYFISIASNQNIALSFDQAEYVGAARDFLETGVFHESTHSQSLGVLLPLGYPMLIALVAKVLGSSPHQAALQINLAAGVLLPLLTFGLVWRLTASPVWSLLGGMLVASHWQMVQVAARAMTDPVYSCLFTILALWTTNYFTREKPGSGLVLGGVGGLLVGGMYLLRVSALFMLPGLPFVWLCLNGWMRKMPWGRLARAIALFLLLAGLVVAGVTWRFHQVNGGWSLSPQVSFNARMGDFKVGLHQQVWTLDENGSLVIRTAKSLEGGNGGGGLAELLASLARNLRLNALFIKEQFSPPEGVSGRHWWFWLPMLALPLWARWRARKRREEIPQGAAKSLDGSGATPWLAALALLVALAFLADFMRPLAHPPSLLVMAMLLALACAFFLELGPSRGCAAARQASHLHVGLLVTGGLWVMHILAYSLLNAKERYMAQAYPLGVAFLLGLAHTWLGEGHPRRALAACLGWASRIWRGSAPITSSAEGGVPDATGSPARSALIDLAALAVVVYLSCWVVLQANATLPQARKYQAVTAQSPNTVREAGLIIKNLAEARGVPARMVQDDSGVAYHAHGQGYMVPYLETRPERLLRFLATQKIFFVTCQPFTAFGDVFTGIGLRHLLSAMLAGGLPGVESHAKDLVFSLGTGLALDLEGRGDGFPDQGLALEAPGFHLLWLQLRGKPLYSAKQYKKVSTEPLTVVELRRGTQSKALAAGTLCAGPRLLNQEEARKSGQTDKGDFTLYQVVKTPERGGDDREPWRVSLVVPPAMDLSVVDYSLYRIKPQNPAEMNASASVAK